MGPANTYYSFNTLIEKYLLAPGYVYQKKRRFNTLLFDRAEIGFLQNVFPKLVILLHYIVYYIYVLVNGFVNFKFVANLYCLYLRDSRRFTKWEQRYFEKPYKPVRLTCDTCYCLRLRRRMPNFNMLQHIFYVT